MRITVLLSSLMLVAAVFAGASAVPAAAESAIHQASAVHTPALVPYCAHRTGC